MSSHGVRINDLPDDMLRHVVTFLPHLTLRQEFSLVCPRWNNVAFDGSYLDHIQLKLTLTKENVWNLPQISRKYRTIILRCHLMPRLDEEETQTVLRWFGELSTAMKEFIYWNPGTSGFLALKILDICPRVKKVRLDSHIDLRDDRLPVLQNLEELIALDTSYIDIIQLAPNLHRLETSSGCYNLPTVIKTLRLEHLGINLAVPDINVFQDCIDVTNLKSVDLLESRIDQTELELLCKFCPLLTKLRISPRVSLQCLTRLTHLKVLSLYNVDNKSFAGMNLSLQKVEILEFIIGNRWPFSLNTYLRDIFPHVYHLKFSGSNPAIITTPSGTVRDAFPGLRTLEILHFSNLENLTELPNMRELILRNMKLSDNDLPRMANVQQLTLKDTDLRVTNNIGQKLPSLKFLNLYGMVRRNLNASMLPAGCLVRRYRRDIHKDIFNVI